jgi:hypothetical protein
MRKTRIRSLIVAAITAAIVAIPLTAAAAPVPYNGTLKNNYGLVFSGQARCVSCHPGGYDQTTHGQFVQQGVGDVPALPNPIFSQGGAAVAQSDVFVTLGYGTGLRELLQKFNDGQVIVPATSSAAALTASPQSYLGLIAGLESFYTVQAGGQNVFLAWEYPNETPEPAHEAYCGGNCHNLGYTKGAPNANSTGQGSSSTYQGWAAPWNQALDTTQTQYDLRTMSSTGYMAGAGIQCENCHGTGVSGPFNHWGAGVMISTQNGPNPLTTSVSAADARPLMRSDVCGQCHGTSKSGSNWLGYTPNKPLYLFAGIQIGATEIPTRAQYAADVASYTADPTNYNRTGTATTGRLTYRYLWPGGINSGFMFPLADGTTYQAGIKHVYYTEWSLSSHSFRSQLTSTSPDASMYQKSTTLNGLGGSSKGPSSPGTATASTCFKCHAGEGYAIRKNDPIAANFANTNDNMGWLGVECSSCHVVHNVATQKDGEVGMGLRTPEPGNLTFCEDCHVDRRIVQGQAITPITFSQIGASLPHAVEGTVLHGGGMYDVPKTQGFMSNVECYKCHMPATRADFPTVGLERYADRSFKRYTHSMKIVEPGDPVLNPQPWQDSCSPCHPGLSQTQLQDYIDQLQSTNGTLSADASAAIVAASLRTAPVDAGATTLINRAYTNWAFEQAEGSNGFHNPGYTQAGLHKAIKMANDVGGRFANFLGSSALANHQLGFVAGTIVAGTGAGASEETVTLLIDNAVSGTTLSDPNGNFSFMIVGDGATHTYKAVWKRCGDATADITSGNAVISSPVVKLDTDLTLSINRQTAKRGVRFTLTGELHAGPSNVDVAHATIQITYKKPGSSTWATASPTTTNSDGKFTRTYDEHILGTWTFRVRFAGDSTHLASTGTHSISIIR